MHLKQKDQTHAKPMMHSNISDAGNKLNLFIEIQTHI